MAVGWPLVYILLIVTLAMACHWRRIHPDNNVARKLFNLLFRRGEGRRSNRRSINGELKSKVTVEIYVEALCIDSKNYMTEQILPAYQTLGPTIMDLSIVSFGNAQFTSDHQELSCQHGAAECDVNSYQQCAAFVYDDEISRYLSFVACLFERLPMGHRDVPFAPVKIAACSGSLHWPSLHKCHDNATLALELQTRAAVATPPHTYVPWIVIDGVHQTAEGDLVEMICAAYKGSSTNLCPGSFSRVQSQFRT